MMKMLLVVGARLYGRGRGRRMMSTSTSTNPPNPWLMLPPTFDRRRGGMVYNFYSLADQEVVLINKYGPGAEPPEIPDDNARVVGSSHGWLALMNNRNNELFLSNPITRRHIRLPPIQSLPDPVLNLHHVSGKATVSKLILSAASPGSEECRAMVSYGQDDRLAFCCPGHSQEWVPIGKPYMDEEDKTFKLVYPKSYDDFVYSSKSNVFSCLTKSEFHASGLEEWDLRDMDSPKLAWIQRQNNSPLRPIDDEHLKEKHLAYVEQTDKLLLVTRFIHKHQHKTHFFGTLEIIKHNGWKSYRKCPSSDLALFLGTNHAFTISHFNPNSIYFTHHKQHHHQPDVGICHHDFTLSDCYYPLHRIITNTNTNTDTNTVTAPIWFTPTLT
ncbi:uncharacterized protein LOC121804337 [Salvia splendens]|uniref:uncharacterized protein LOC121804337 n=1 Tax=Salvia splendens TaxID=180675 RepID=UPI001C2614D2|nr:uncharacterized protein LOC121804337 [Salvia splendens]